MKRFLIPLPDGRLCVYSPVEGREVEGLATLIWSYEADFGVILPAFEVPVTDLTSRRVFREAWKMEAGDVVVDMPKARLIHMDRIRQVRDAELEKESGSKYRQPPEIEALFTPARQAKLQALRDIPQTFDLAIATTPGELKALWPSELPLAS